MIRKLLASTAMLALMTAGSFSIAQAQDTPAQTDEPAAIEEQDATGAPDATAEPSADAAAAEEKLTPEEPTLATAFIGRSVFSSEDPESDNIGEVNDLIVSDDGSITHAVVGVGGFLGIGEKDVAVPFEELQVVEQEGDIRLVYAATKEQLEAAEEFDRTAYDPNARFQEEQAAMAPATDATAPAGGLAPAPAPAGDMTATEPVEPAEDMAADAGAEAPAEDMAADDTAAEEPDATADATAPAPSGDMAADATAEQDLAAADAGTDSTTEPEAAVDATADATTEPDAATADAADATAGEDLAADADTDTGADATAEQDVAAAGTDAAPMDGDAGFMSFDASQIRASTMLGKEVLGPDDESIGEISDLVLQEDGGTRAAIIDVGGFLGAGEKPVAIPFDQIEVQPQEGGEPRLSIAMTREELEQAPAFEDATMGSEEDMAATDQTGAEAPADVTADTATEPAPADDMAADATAPAEGQDVIAGSQEGTGAYELATQDLSAEELIGSAVYGSNDENLGEVGDVVFADSGDIEAVVVDVGGFLGVGEKPVAVQFDALNVQKDTAGDVQLMINASQEQLEGAPTYQEEQAAVQ